MVSSAPNARSPRKTASFASRLTCVARSHSPCCRNGPQCHRFEHLLSSSLHHMFGRIAAATSAVTLLTIAARQAASSGRAVKRATPSRPAARRLMRSASQGMGRAQSTSAAMTLFSTCPHLAGSAGRRRESAASRAAVISRASTARLSKPSWLHLLRASIGLRTFHGSASTTSRARAPGYGPTARQSTTAPGRPTQRHFRPMANRMAMATALNCGSPMECGMT